MICKPCAEAADHGDLVMHDYCHGCDCQHWVRCACGEPFRNLFDLAKHFRNCTRGEP